MTREEYQSTRELIEQTRDKSIMALNNRYLQESAIASVGDIVSGYYRRIKVDAVKLSFRDGPDAPTVMYCGYRCDVSGNKTGAYSTIYHEEIREIKTQRQ